MRNKKYKILPIMGILTTMVIIFSLIYLIILSQNNLCKLTGNQKVILNSEVPNNTDRHSFQRIVTERKIMMRSIQKDMAFSEYFCINNPQQLLIRKFYDVPLEEDLE